MLGTRVSLKLCITFWQRTKDSDNFQMHIEDIFEDLEALFDASLQKIQRDVHTENVRALEVQTTNHTTKELIAPIIGSEFLAGLDSLSPIWHIYPTGSVRRIRLHSQVDESLPKIRTVPIALETFLKSIPLPCAIRWRYAGVDEYLHQGSLHSIAHSLLFIYVFGASNPIAVPIHALGQLSIESVDNLNGDF